MNELMEQEELRIENMIYEIRGKQVMFSSDIAKLYDVEPKILNQTIKRNANRFPESFCFQLTHYEKEDLRLRSQFVTLNKNNNMRGQHLKYLPYALTEQGIMMLSGLLKSDIAVKINIQIIDAFVKIRKYISTSKSYYNG
jgi:phage regulator Rha-like protein